MQEDVIQLELFQEELCEVEHERVRYILRRNPMRAEELSRTREKKLAGQEQNN
jgi:hypothetical protein